MHGRLSSTENTLIAAMEQMDVIDAHEHLEPEHLRVSQPVDVFTLLGHYTAVDLLSAGMPRAEFDRLFDRSVALVDRWRSFREWFPYVKHGSYARAGLIAAREIYGCDDVNDDTYETLSQRMQEANKPGIYRRILRDKCRIRTALAIENADRGRDHDNADLFSYLKPLGQLTLGLSADGIQQQAETGGVRVKSLDDYLQHIQQTIRKWREEGAVGLKTHSHPLAYAEKGEVEVIFREVMDRKRTTGGDRLAPVADPLRDFLLGHIMTWAAELGLVVAVHTGMWGDFRDLDPKHFLPLFRQHPETQFDLYHMGMPSVRDTAVIAKNCPNVNLNLCWSHVISPVQARSGLDEYMDMVPLNKIIGFGADYRTAVEKVYGHLVMARENIAAVLGRRIDRDLLGLDEAIHIAQMWLFDNPVRIYNLDTSDTRS